MNTDTGLRPSPIAGQWYDDRPEQLSQEIDSYLAGARLPKFAGDVVAVIAPHAGHRYSGPVAGFAFRAVQDQAFDLVAVVAPMHRPYYEPLFTSGHTGYQTPLGPISIDAQAVADLDEQLRQQISVGLTPILRDSEHSLEIELPFLQRALKGDFQLLPVMVRDQSPRLMQALGQALAETLRGRRALLVASSDLSHFYPRQVAGELDAETLRQIEAFSPEGLYRVSQEGKGYACGLGAVAAVLWAASALGGTQASVLEYATSGEITLDFSSVVGYGAAVVTRPQ